MNLVTLDFESYYSTTYSLRSAALSTSGYIRHPEFKLHCMGLKHMGNPTEVYFGSRIEEVLRSIDWNDTAMLAHHAAFDGLILSHHFGIVPKYYFDTLGMARALHSNAIGAGLDEVAGFYKLGHKTPKILEKLKGVREPDPELLALLGEYCGRDVDLCYGVFQRMEERIPQPEFDLIDLTVRMFTDPVLELDLPRLKDELGREQEEKAGIIAQCPVGLTILSSAEKFAHELKCSGLNEPPTKKSKTTGKPIWAFSKTDLAFLDLQGHESARVRSLVAARLAAKSTIGESRAKRLIDAGRGGLRLPVYLKYYGAHTGRWSGGDKINLQNLPRAEYDKDGNYVPPSAELRRSIKAPPGHVLVVCDSAQIEARMLAWLADDTEQLALFRAKRDVYKMLAAAIYHMDVANVTKDQRFIGKVATLGLGYGMGRDRFKLTLALGAMGAKPIFLSDDQAWHIVTTYRNTRAAVPALWRKLESILHGMTRKRDGEFKCLRADGEEKKVYFPNGMFLQYPYLESCNDGFQFFDYKAIIRNKFGVSKDPEKGKLLHGGIFTENIDQGLSRIVIGEQMLEIKNYLCEVGDGLYRRIVTMSHDEIVVCVPEPEAQATYDYMLGVMRTPPTWAPDLPLDADGGFAEVYAK